MVGNRVLKASVCFAAAALVATAGIARAQVSASDAKCRATIQKNAGKLGSTAMKTIDGCIKSLLGGKVGATTNCNSLAVADSKGKVSGTAGKTTAGIAKSCLALPTNIVAGTTNCPSPANTDDAGGATTAVDSVTELGNCQVTLNTDPIELLRNYILRPNAAAILASANAKGITSCANAIAKGATGLWSTVSKERGKCQATSDKGGGAYAYSCSTYDASGKIASSAGKLAAGIDKSCAALSQAELALIGSCASDIPTIKACVTNAVKKNASGATAAAFEFAGECPATVRVVVNGGGKNGQRNSSTRLDTGWTGLGHDADVVDGFTGRVALSCSSDDCSSCSVTASCAEGNCRCANDASISCTTPFVTGGPCGANLCVVMFGPPLPLSAGGAPTCVVNTIEEAFTGTADVGRGTSDTPIKSIAKVWLGITQTQPCPTCSGTAVGSTGTCNGGGRNGLACTTNAVNTAYGNTSYDCPPNGANVSGSGLKINLDLTDASASLSPGDPCDSPLGAYTCTCGGCSLDPTTACQTDADCSGAGLGTCNNAGGPGRQPNACGDLVCSNDGSGQGVCNAGPNEGFCDGKLKTNGKPYIQCSTDADCLATDPAAGNCTIFTNRPCFLNPIAATGVAGTDGAELVSTFCSGATVSASVNGAAGEPGPGRVKLDFDYTGLCADGSTQYELGGSNCP